MYSRVVVPIDYSELAWTQTAVGPARLLAQRWGATLEVVSVVHHGRELEHATTAIERHLAAHGWQDETIVTVVERRKRQVAVADVVADQVKRHPGSLVVMTSHGRGRSAALFGSVAERLLQLVAEPIMVFGPSIDSDHVGFAGRMLVCVDRTKTSETALDVAAPWALELRMEPWVVSVTEIVPAVIGGEQIVETAYPHRMADRIAVALGHEVDYDALHGRDPAKAIATFARSYEGGLIVAATHGRIGHDRLSNGSVAMNIVHHAPCPVLLIPAPDSST